MAGIVAKKWKTIACAGIAFLWGGLMIGQTQKQLGTTSFGRSAAASPDVRYDLPPEGAEGSVRMGVFVGDRRVGELRQEWSREEGVLTVKARLSVALDSMLDHVSTPQGMRDSDLMVCVDSRSVVVGRALETLLVEARIGNQDTPFAMVYGRMLGDRLAVRVRRAGEEEAAEYTLSPENSVNLACFPLVALPRLRPGMTWTVAGLDPMTLNLKHGIARVNGRAGVPGSNGAEATVVRVGEGSGGTTFWVDDCGAILRKSVMGLVFVLEEEEAEGNPVSPEGAQGVRS